MIYNIFGSENSNDIDIMVLEKEIGTIDDSKYRCLLYGNTLKSRFNVNKDININLCTVRNGFITNVFKGSIDECNNSLYTTYNNFPQQHPKIVTKSVFRDYDIKILRAIRIITQFLSRTSYRQDVKKALNQNLEDQIKILYKIKFDSSFDFGKTINKVDIYKKIAFQIIQTTLLIVDNIEIYTKNDAIKYCVLLNGFINRDENKYDFSALNTTLEFLLNYITDNYCYLHKYNEKNWK